MNCIPHQPAGANPRSRSHSCTPKPSKPRSIIDKLKRWLAGGVAEQHLPKKQRTTKKHFRGPSTVRGAPAWSMPLESRFTVEVDANVSTAPRMVLWAGRPMRQFWSKVVTGHKHHCCTGAHHHTCRSQETFCFVLRVEGEFTEWQFPCVRRRSNHHLMAKSAVCLGLQDTPA